MAGLGSSVIPNLFLISAGIACLTCFSRPDFNLPLMAFAYLTWDHKHVTFFTCQSPHHLEFTKDKSILADGIFRNHRYFVDPHLGNFLE